MKKDQVTRRLAKESRVATAVAADQVDRIVSDLLMRVRKGESASLPGLGTFQSGSQQEFQFDRDPAPQSEPARPRKKSK
jgi:nucleoid DNA-binding protein